MRIFLPLFLAFFLFLALPAGAADGPEAFNPKVFQVPALPVTGPDGVEKQGQMEVVLGEAEGSALAAQMAGYLERDLAQRKAANPSLDAEIGVVDSDEIARPKKGIAKRTWDWIRNNKYRVKFALARLVMGQQTTMWTLMLADAQKAVPFWPAFFTGIYGGLVQGGFMLFNPQWQDFITGGSWIRRGMGWKADTLWGRSMDITASAARWIGTELFFVTIYKIILYQIGQYYGMELVPSESALAFSWFLLRTTGLNTFGEFPWGMTIGALREHSIKAGGSTQEAIDRAQFQSDVRVLGLSGFATAAIMMQNMRLPMGEQLLMGIAGSGWLLYMGVRYFKGPAPERCSEELKAASGQD